MKFNNDGEACKLLESRGFELTREWNWKTKKSKEEILPDEWEAMNYLFNEYDWGYYEKNTI